MSAERKAKKRGPRKAPLACGPDLWSPRAWRDSFGIGTTTYYRLEPKPKMLRVGGLYFITESPGEYVRRVGKPQEQEPQAA